VSGTTNNTPTPAIAAASTPNDVILAAANDPALKAALIQAFGTQLAEAQKSPWGMLAGAAIGFVGTRYGVSLDPAVQAIAAGVLAILGGDLWQWASGKWWPAAVTQTQGKTP
jgi:hypothetical protein